MILNIICFYNKVVECYTTPNFDDHEPEKAAKQLERSLILNKDDQKIVKTYRFLDMYCLGVFDDSDGSIKLLKKPLKLLDCSEVLGIDFESLKTEILSNMKEVNVDEQQSV